MKTREMIGSVLVILFLGVVGTILIQPNSADAQSQRPIPIGRYEFLQDGVVCYRTNGLREVALSCVKVR